MTARIILPAVFLAAGLTAQEPATTLYLVPNTHGTIAGWLVDFNTERNYVLNNYLDHLDRVKADPEYRFAWSEAPNLISLLEFAPRRLGELKQRVREKRVELSNGFFLEPSVTLSGGEALVEMGVQGLRWYEAVFGLRPRHCWMIDVVGLHGQMPQIVSGLGMETLIFCRNNQAKKTAFWWVAPDGTRVLALNNAKTYADFRKLFTTKEPLDDAGYAAIARVIEEKLAHSPSRKSLLSLAGQQDYSLPPDRREYPSEFLREWSRRYPKVRIRFSTPSDYLDALLAEMKSGEVKLEEYSGDTAHSYNAFWMNMPQVKREYRRSEHLLQAAEMAATAASLKGGFRYPAQEFYHSWIQMLVNMDRNVIWGAGTGEAFQDAKNWDAWDRFASVQKQAGAALTGSLEALSGKGDALVAFNPLNWDRQDPLPLELPAGKRLEGVDCESVPGGSSRALCRPNLPSTGSASFTLVAGSPAEPKEIPFSETIETNHYTVKIDAKTGALTSLKVNSTGKEILGGPANVVVAESVAGVIQKTPADSMVPRPQRKVVSTSSGYPAQIRTWRGTSATTVRVSSEFQGGSRLERTIVLHRDYRRIDFETSLDLRETDLVITADFPLAADVKERTRGIPYGFSSRDPAKPAPPEDYFLNVDHATYGYSEAILPAVRWSSYQFARGGGLALLDRGLTSHELNGRTVTLALVNAQATYRNHPNELLRGIGSHRFEYAIVPYGGTWQEARVPRVAWEFNTPVFLRVGRGAGSESFLRTSDNVIVEAMRRVGSQIEVRLAEWKGAVGEAEVTLNLPHRKAAITNMMGEKPTPLTGGPGYRFPIRPQQIVTLRFETASRVLEPSPIRTWKSIVPAEKQKTLETRIEAKGHPPRRY